MRKILYLLITVVLLLPSLVLAEDHTQQSGVLCGSLTAADCAILNESQTAMSALNSAAFDVRFDLNVNNLNEGDVAVLAVGNGVYHLDLPKWDDTQRFNDGPGFVRYLAKYLRDVSASLNLTISAQAGSDVEAVALQLRLVDSVGYMNFNGLQALTGGSRLNGWGGLELEAFLRLMLDQDPTVFDPFMSGLAVDNSAPLLDFNYIDIQRVKTTEPGMASFETRLKLSDLFEDPAFTSAYQQQLDEMGGAGPNSDMVVLMAQMMVGDSELVMRQNVRLDDYYVQSLDMSYDLDLTRLMQNMLFGDASPSQLVHFDFAYHLEYDDFNAAAPVEVPGNVLDILDYNALQRLMSGSAPL